ncbi:ArsR/SmtB family transcription factor [Aquifex aeolicus]|uniref:Transcriptional regulator (ArsR family) n=1 Tax=Aquifex aeolicus (strain VF5) TaxID=224324 RepID=O67394_AQUAE|nr:metalloregulator ArsR/SmtB family transcription factor [Aquifex aeolicus]AAC07355.1 transcriptional regulator (ArsR family) [Aquifex aeolicus VF5]
MDCKELARIFYALSEPKRLCMVKLLLEREELCVCDFMRIFKESQPKISFHLKVLREAGLVTSQKRGKWNYYRLNKEAPVIPCVEKLLKDVKLEEKIQLEVKR